MDHLRHIVGLGVVAVALAGCSMGSSMLNNKSSVPQANNVQVGNNLAMPPDLQLPPPGQGADTYQQPVDAGAGSALDAGIATQKPTKKMAAATMPMAPAAAAPDVFEQNGISKIKADGTKKSANELREELKIALLRKKQQANPNYGTIRNIGKIFSDQ